MITFKKINSAKIVKNESNYVYCIEVEKNHNFNANGINLKNCCRLKNELSTVGKDGKQEYVNSFGVGRNFYTVLIVWYLSPSHRLHILPSILKKILLVLSLVFLNLELRFLKIFLIFIKNY